MSQNTKVVNGAQAQEEDEAKSDESPRIVGEQKGESEALVIGDGTPRWLSALLSTLDEPSRYRSDAFVCALDVLMHESGFFSNEPSANSPSFDIRTMRSLTERKIRFDVENANYQLTYHYSNMDNKCILIAVPVHDAVIVNLFAPDLITLSLSFDLAKYVNLKNEKASIKNGKELAFLFKNALCTVKSAFPTETPNPDHILSLPIEILISISQYLTPVSFFYFASSCKQLYYSLYNVEVIWKHIARMYFPSRNLTSESWKKFVIYQHRSQVERKRSAMNAVDIYGRHLAYEMNYQLI